MKKALLIFIMLLALTKALSAQNQITEIEKLAVTAKIWGFLKYYHPEVAGGKYNWDEQLFKIMPNIKNSISKEQLSQVFMSWINDLGEIKDCNKCSQKKETQIFNENFDLNWIENQNVFIPKLSDLLKTIEINRHQGEKHYVSSVLPSGKIEIKNELPYKNFDWKDENMRLLTLFRYWNIIEYFFPYKYQTTLKWNEVLNQMIPKFLNPKTEIDFHVAILELLASIDDGHTFFGSNKIDSFFGIYWFPAKFKIVDNKVIITGFYNDSIARLNDLKIGDVITKLNNKEVKTIFKKKEKFIFGSNLSHKKSNANSIFHGMSNSVKVELIRENKTLFRTVKRYLYKDFNYKFQFNKNKGKDIYKLLNDNIGYVNMGAIKIKDVANAMKTLENTKAIIFDIRKYPNGTVYEIIKYISSKEKLFYKNIIPDLNYPGKFIWKEGRKVGGNSELKYKGKVILLVNHSTISQSEFTTMCFQTGDNVITIGSQTAGTDGNVSRFLTVGGFPTQMSAIGIFYPNNKVTQRKGVKIDVIVQPTIKGIIEGRDEILEKAIEYANN